MTVSEYAKKEIEQLTKEIITLHEKKQEKLIETLKNKRAKKSVNPEEIKYIKHQIRKREERIKQLEKKR